MYPIGGQNPADIYLTRSWVSYPKNFKNNGMNCRERGSITAGIFCKACSNNDNIVTDGVLSDAGLTNNLKQSSRPENKRKLITIPAGWELKKYLFTKI